MPCWSSARLGCRSISLLPLLLHAETSPGSQNAAGRDAAWPLRALITRVDKLRSVHSATKGGTVPTVEVEENAPASIAAVRGGNRGSGGRTRGLGRTKGRQRSQPVADAAPAATGVPTADPTPSDLVRVSSGLCHFHWVYADKVGKCVGPCSWGN